MGDTGIVLPATKADTSPALIGGFSALAIVIIVVVSVAVTVIGLWRVFTKHKQRPQCKYIHANYMLIETIDTIDFLLILITHLASSKPQPNTSPGMASWHNLVYTASDSLGMPGGHTQPPSISASCHEYDIIGQGGATVHIKLNSDDKMKPPTSTGTAEEDYSTPADALTDGGFIAKKGLQS